MKKAFVLILSVFPMIASGDYLDDKIADLTKQKLEKIAELEECQKSSKGLKIAGITTLGVSTVGIAANIGEAVALKKLDGQISEAETKLGDLDEQIQDKKDENERKEQQANTCGVQQCNVAERNAKMATLNAKDVVCVNGAWVPSACKDGFSGTTATCTLNSTTVTYYMSCTQDAKTCEKITDEWKEQNHVEQVECDTTIGENYITKCKNGYSGTQRTSGNQQGYKMCQKNEGGKKCPDITDEWLNKNNAKSGACDGITRKNYITECKEDYVGIARVDGNQQGYENCQKKQVQEKKCPDITDEWLNKNNAKSAACDETTRKNYITECKDGYSPERNRYGVIWGCIENANKKLVIEYFIQDNGRYGLERMFSINAKLNSKSIAYVGRNKEDLIKQLESAVNDLGYTNFELVEKK